MNHLSIASMSNDALLSATRELAVRSNALEADLLVLLGEIDERKLYLDRAFSSMFAFCTGELGFSEAAAYNRIQVARAARRFPALIEAVRSGRVHLAGLRLLTPHLTEENHAALVSRAAGRTKEQIAELVAALAPRPAPAAQIRKLPAALVPAPGLSAPPLAALTAPARPEEARSAAVAQGTCRPQLAAFVPVAEDTYRLQLAISRQFREEIRDAQALLRHRVPDGDLATIFRAALAQYVAGVKKERFAVGRAPRSSPEAVIEAESRHVPDALKRAVYERDSGRCTFVSDEGRRCDEKGALEFDHVDGFARTRQHDLDGLRLLCRAHNQHAAEKVYGRAFMERKRANSSRDELAAQLPLIGDSPIPRDH